MRIALEIENNIARIQMDDGKANALDLDWFNEMHEILDSVENANVTSLSIFGRDGIFCGGLNTKWLPTMNTDEQKLLLVEFPRIMERIFHLPMPTVAAMAGHAIAGGFIIACACDTRIAVEGDYRVHMNEVMINMTVPDWISRIIRYVTPKPWAERMLNLAEPMSFSTAHSLGIIDRFVEEPKGLQEAVRLVQEHHQLLDPNSFTQTKASLKSAG